MAVGPARRLELGALLLAVERAAPVQAVEALAEELARVMAADHVGFLMADYGGTGLARLVRAGPAVGTDDGSQWVPIEGTPQGRVLRTQRVHIEPSGAGAWFYAPVTDRGEALGVLELRLAAPPDEATAADAALAGHALAYVVIANSRYTDLYERAQRTLPLDLAAEIQRRLLPASFTCEAAQCTIAGFLEPAATAAGDTFDYSLSRGALHATLTDAMGHDLSAAQLASLVVASLRNSRRRGYEVVEQAHQANQDLLDHTSSDQFVTGLLLRVDLASGQARLVNAGHPVPYLLRDGEVTQLPHSGDPPFGVIAAAYLDYAFHLQAGDRLLLVTDGMLERNASRLDVPTELHATRDLHPRELVQHLTRRVTAAVGGPLHDDATVLCVDWHGGMDTQRHVGSGADPSRASRPL
ncbi:MAG TPA: PP2C family protein-serine/threonine phosphatase [Mycobacteriales bacterium]|nr:PP2C family protein-serine/threonine phosphatase [Mycobacteriales bacterium]